MRIKLRPDIGKGMLSRLPMFREAVLEALKAKITEELQLMIQATVKRRVTYMKALEGLEVSVDGDYIIIEFKGLLEKLDQGYPQSEMRRDLLTGSSSRRAKAGHRYAYIPIEDRVRTITEKVPEKWTGIYGRGYSSMVETKLSSGASLTELLGKGFLPTIQRKASEFIKGFRQ